MGKQNFENNTALFIAEFLAANDTQITVANTNQLKPLAVGDYYIGTIVPVGGLSPLEIVKITAFTGNVLTVERAQEGTAAQNFLFGSTLELRVTAGFMTRASGISRSDGFDGTTPSESFANGMISGSNVITPPGLTSVTLTTAQQALATMGNLKNLKVLGDPLQINFPAGQFTVSTGDIGTVVDNGSVQLIGATPVVTSLSSIASVTGSVGNWTVTINVPSTAGMSIGDVAIIRNVLQGQYYTATAVVAPAPNQMMVGFGRMGAVTTSTGSASVSVASGTVSSNISPGYLVHIGGQTRTVISVDTATTFTVDSPFTFGFSGLQWWYYTLANSGQLVAGGPSTTVTGSGTAFLSQANVGDLLLVDGVAKRITAIASNTSLTVNGNLTLGANSNYSIITAGITHEGAYQITNIVGNTITYQHRGRLRAPPVNGVTGGEVTVLKTVFKNTGVGNGLVWGNGGVLGLSDNIAYVGNNSSTTSVGMALNGVGATYNQKAGSGTFGPNTAIINWGDGVFASTGSNFNGQGVAITNNLANGAEITDGADAYFRDAIISHNAGIGALNSGGFMRISNARFCCNGLQGTRQDVGSGVYGDQPWAWGNNSHGFLLVNFCGVQWADGFSNCNGGNGANFQNAPGGRISRTMFAGNSQHNLSISSAKVEATQCWMTGASTGQSGAVCSQAEVTLTNSYQTGNGAAGLFVVSQSPSIVAVGTFQTKNGTNGIRADDKSMVYAIEGLSTGNTGTNYSAVTGGQISTPNNLNMTVFAGSIVRQAPVTLADDTATSFYIGNNTHRILLVSSSLGSLHADLSARAGASATTTGITLGTNVAVTTGVLTGTTGADGVFTISAATDGYFYFENRQGAGRQVTFIFIGQITE